MKSLKVGDLVICLGDVGPENGRGCIGVVKGLLLQSGISVHWIYGTEQFRIETWYAIGNYTRAQVENFIEKLEECNVRE